MAISQEERDAAHAAVDIAKMESIMMENDTMETERPAKFEDLDDAWLSRQEDLGDGGEGGFIIDPRDDISYLVTAGRKLWNDFASIVYETQKDPDNPDKIVRVKDEDGNDTIKSKRFAFTQFGEWLVKESGEHYSTLDDNNEIYYYKGGIYNPGGEVRIKYLVYEIMNCDLASIKAVSEVLSYVRSYTTVRRDEFDINSDIINMANGLYSITSEKLIKHTPDYKSFSKLNIEYDAKATCPVVDYFINDCVEPHRIDAMYEIIGYSMLPRKTLKRGIILTGVSNTGKSTMITLMTDMLGGMGKVASVAPNQMGTDTHAAADMYGIGLNIIDDLGTTKIKETGIMKSIISCKPIRANQKYGKPFVFTPNILMVFGCNLVPECNDEYMRDKFDILEFNNRHEGGEINDTIDIELSVPSEQSGLFNKAMKAVKTALKNKDFTGADTIDDRAKAYLYKSNSVARFVDECMDTSDPEAYIEKKVFKQAYATWCKEHKFTQMQVGIQTSYLADEGHMLVRQGERGAQEYIYLGIQFKVIEQSSIFKFTDET